MNATARLAFTRGAMLLMEALWVYALVAFLAALIVEGDRPSPFGVLAVVFISFSISRLLMQSDLSIGVIRVWGIVMSLLVFYVIVRIDFFGDLRIWDFGWLDELLLDTTAALQSQSAKNAMTGIPLLWFVWMRGLFRGQQHITFESVVGNFAIGVVVVAIVEAFVGVVETPATVGHVAVPYIAVGLLAIATTQAARADGDEDRPFATTWFGVVGGAVLALAVLGLLFALVDLGEASHAIGVVSEAIGVVVSRIVYYILYPFILATIVMFEVLKSIWESVYGERPPLQLETSTPVPPEEATEPADVPEWFNWILRLIIGVPLIAAILGGLWFLFSKYARRPEPQETKESTYQEGRLSADLGDLLGSLLRRIRPGHGGDGLDPARRLYFDMLHAGEDRKIERKPPETPLELAPRLEDAFAGPTPSRITAVFDDVRYGGLPPLKAEVDQLRTEWDELRKR